MEIIGDSKTIPQVDPGILNIIDKGELNYWLSKFVVEVRKKKDPGNIEVVTRGNNYHPKSIDCSQLCWKLSLNWSR